MSAAREVEDEGGCDDAPATALGPVTEANLGALLPTVVSMVVVILAQSAATSRAYAMRSGPLAYMPNAVLASVVFLIGLRLVDYRGMAMSLGCAGASSWSRSPRLPWSWPPASSRGSSRRWLSRS